ncbi:MAG TPA: hypothetical protein PKD86_17535 [Gemmatales bacterium]|nr:hypothetical protein [Gemmatales bacterium]HMP61149.1 hypothetical protein [Gemmatales bacterium]
MIVTLMSCWLSGCLLLLQAEEPETPPVAPSMLPLLAEVEEYKKLSVEEQRFEGILEYLPGTGRIGLASRFTGLQLRWLQDGKVRSVPLVTLDRDEALVPSVSFRVEVAGKLIRTGTEEDAAEELWVGGFVVKSPAPRLALTELRPIARASNIMFLGTPNQAAQARTVVMRSARDVVAAMRLTGNMAERQATDQLAKALGVRTIDWRNQMVVHVASPPRAVGGMLLSIKRLQVGDQGLVVEWSYDRVPNLGNRATAYPSETVLVPKIDGEVKFVQRGTNDK